MDHKKTLILGGGVTGLAAGSVSGLKVYEAQQVPGGICSSYYLKSGSKEPLFNRPEDGEAYRFEIGGGHWIFGGDPKVLNYINSIVPTKSYSRKSAVYFSKKELYVPYPIQNHLAYLGKDIAEQSLNEITNAPEGVPKTMADWIEKSFGKTLTELFFAPFHELYTAGLWTEIAPQDAYKSPVNPAVVRQGAFDKAPPAVGYNVTYVYPEEGLNTLAQRMALKCDINYDKRVSRISIDKKEVSFSNGSGANYDNLVSTLPLNKAMEMAGLEVDEEPAFYTSVLVLNIGATRGSKCPDDHWLYIPDSDSRFHRVGFYSNVDVSFLPRSSRKNNDRVSIYVERAYKNGQKPSNKEIETYSESVVKELKSWGFIQEAETVHPTWIDVAYTWSTPGSNWKELAISELEKHGVYQVGRYGRWIFQGIAESIEDGFSAGNALGGA
ncbi:MAG: FAD-dependent oxidoreductase [Candidatus Dadabacteria bacterium]|nr:FAD-dependent oxidoreductase [Candidatus Dadabacteria bacterium]